MTVMNIRGLGFKGNECPYQVRKYTGSEFPDLCSLNTDMCILVENLDYGIYKQWLLKRYWEVGYQWESVKRVKLKMNRKWKRGSIFSVTGMFITDLLLSCTPRKKKPLRKRTQRQSQWCSVTPTAHSIRSQAISPAVSSPFFWPWSSSCEWQMLSSISPTTRRR